MFDILTVLIAVWFAILALILTNILNHVPYPRIRIILPLVCGIVLALYVLALNPELSSGYRGQIEYSGPFLFPVLVPLFISIPLICIGQRKGNFPGEPVEFSGAFISAFLFLTLYQSGIFFHFFQGILASSLLIGSALFVSVIVFFIIERALPVLSGLRDDKQVNQDHQTGKKSAGSDIKAIVILTLCLLMFLSPLFFIDFFDRLDRATMGDLDLYLPDPSDAPQGTINHLTDEKIREYPQLKSLMDKPHLTDYRDSVHIEQKAVNATYLGDIRILCKTESMMRSDGIVYSGSSPATYFVYDGDLYLVRILHYAGEECVRLSLFT
jgi:hypothetical protein